ncbi:MAG: thioredoxin-dependent thiol peroxidase [Planctomycetota bacterium]
MPLIDEGASAPSFSLPDQSGTMHTLAEYAGRPFVLYFYPKDDTSGCTKQACGFRDSMPDFESLDVPVLGVSPDDERSHTKFVDKHDLNFTLLADVPVKPEDAEKNEKGTPTTCNAFGVWQEKSMYGKTYMGVVRTTYLINADGTVAKRWDKVKVPGHVEAVLEATKALHASA